MNLTSLIMVKYNDVKSHPIASDNLEIGYIRLYARILYKYI